MRRVTERHPEIVRPQARSKEKLETSVELVDFYSISSHDTLANSFAKWNAFRGIRVSEFTVFVEA
jgi:hypothetical protein